MGIILATEAQLNRYLEEQERLHDTSVGGVRDAVRHIENRRRALTEDTSQSRELVAIGNGEHLTDKSVRGQQRAIDAIEAADPYGLRTQLPATVEQLARMKDVSPSGIQGATSLIRIVEKQEPLTDKSVRGHNRAAQVAESTPPIAYEIQRPPQSAPEQSSAGEVAAQPKPAKSWMGKIAEQLARLRDAIREWLH